MAGSNRRVTTLAELFTLGAVVIAACGNSSSGVLHVAKTSAVFAEQPAQRCWPML